MIRKGALAAEKGELTNATALLVPIEGAIWRQKVRLIGRLPRCWSWPRAGRGMLG